MTESFVTAASLPDFSLWGRMIDQRRPLSFDLEVTARCNNDCRHCYINLPAADVERGEQSYHSRKSPGLPTKPLPSGHSGA